MAQEQAVPRWCKRSRRTEKTTLTTQGALAATQGEKESLQPLKKGLATHSDYKEAVRLCRAEIRRSKAQLEITLASTNTDNKKCFYKYVIAKERPGRVSIPYWMREETW